jgi:hypothetical protein
MADIFISYSKTDYDLALKLATYLESEGWSVWWDKSLKPADTFRDQIMRQLAASRAVITIWSKNSVKSDWVRAESAAAKKDGKLIPVKTADVAYADIPLPFGEMHTENIASTDLIRAAVVAQLTKPIIPVSAFQQIRSLFKSEALTWIGIVGGAITLFSNLSGLLNLADWARTLVTHWHEWSHAFWSYIFYWLGIKLEIDPLAAVALSFLAFSLMLVIGLNLSTRIRGGIKSEVTLQRRLTLFSLWSLTPWLMFLLLAFLGVESIFSMVSALIAIVLPIFPPFLVVREKLKLAICILLFAFFSVCIQITPLAISSTTEAILGAITGFFLLFQPMISFVLLFTPIAPLLRRLVFLTIALLLLITFNEISKINLHPYLQPPKVSQLPLSEVLYSDDAIRIIS